jgi:hypothetical protein
VRARFFELVSRDGVVFIGLSKDGKGGSHGEQNWK